MDDELVKSQKRDIYVILANARIQFFQSAEGISVPQADLPAGNHTLILSIADSGGKTSSQILHVQIKDKS